MEMTYSNLWLSLRWHTLLHNFFPGDNAAFAMTSYQKRVQDTAYTLKNKVLSLLVTLPKPNLFVTHFFSLLKILVTGFILF